MATQYDIYAAAVSTGWTAGTARTLIEGVATANQSLPEWCDLAYGNMAATGYTIVEIVSYAASGTGTAYTPKRHGTAIGVAVSTWKVNMTVEGTTPTPIWGEVYANPFSMRIQYPLGREFLHPASGIIGLRLTSSVAPTATTPANASLMIEE
jgi:hypothetical protein